MSEEIVLSKKDKLTMFFRVLASMMARSKAAQKKAPTEFVKRMRALDKRAAKKTVLWDSQQQGTYVRAKHGELRRAD